MSALLKQPTIRSKRLMEWARGHDAGCQGRFPGWCVWTPTAGCHAPSGVRFGKGVSTKPPDILIALLCPACHDIVDGRAGTDFDPEFVRLVWHEAHCATEVLMVQDGMIEVAR